MDNWPKGARIIGPDIGPRPSWAVACIVAEYETDQSDIQADYFATRTETQVHLAWSRHKRDVFSEMRKAAMLFKPTRHLGPGCDVWTARVVLVVPAPGYFADNGRMIHDGDRDHNPERGPQTFQTKAEAEAWIAAQPALLPCHYGEHVVTYRWRLECESIEHREKYSMGAGYYLKGSMGYSTGWTVSKVSYGQVIQRERPALQATTTTTGTTPEGDHAKGLHSDAPNAKCSPCRIVTPAFRLEDAKRLATGAPAAERGVCPACHAETKPGEQLYRDGSCWPQCLTATRPRLVVEPMYPDARS